jgi:hypothetical protein
MPKSLQIKIDEPCHENWQSMTPNEQGRFCGSCQKTVVDFSVMTDQEILDYISKASHSICGRMSDDQMNKDILITKNKKRFSFVYLWNLLLATLLFAKANAQVTPVKSKQPTVVKAPERMLMGQIAMPEPEPVDAVIPVTAKGVVVDATNGKPVEGASIFIKAKSSGTVADSTGNFQLSIHKQQPVELVISAIGYETQTVVVDKSTGWQHLKVFMQPSATVLGEVSIIAWPTISCGSRMGAVGIIKKVTITDTVKRNINNLMPVALKKEVKVFPNPVIRGNNVQLSLALKQPGKYKLELMDAAGKVMMVQAVQMPDKERNISIPTHAGWSAGVYWVRISGQHVKSVYQGKVLIK